MGVARAATQNECTCRSSARPAFDRFHALPSFVKIILTARRQLSDRDTAEFFKAWVPESIEPEDGKNMEDMVKLLSLRLDSNDSQVPEEERRAAVAVLARKSKVSNVSVTRWPLLPN
jgi:hypothetical protein